LRQYLDRVGVGEWVETEELARDVETTGEEDAVFPLLLVLRR
jgi:hypothetical protein